MPGNNRPKERKMKRLQDHNLKYYRTKVPLPVSGDMASKYDTFEEMIEHETIQSFRMWGAEYVAYVRKRRWRAFEKYLLELENGIQHVLGFMNYIQIRSRPFKKRRWIEIESYILNNHFYIPWYFPIAFEYGKRWKAAEKILLQKGDLIELLCYTCQIGKPWKEAEKHFLKDPMYAWRYSHHILHSEWPEAEEIILTDPVWTNHYAFSHKHDRWTKGEPTILRDPSVIVEYAHWLMDGRWPEGEQVLLDGHPMECMWYALHSVKGRWPEAEPLIMKHPEAAMKYAFNVIEGPWPEAEPFIRESNDDWYAYNLQVLKTRIN